MSGTEFGIDVNILSAQDESNIGISVSDIDLEFRKVELRLKQEELTGNSQDRTARKEFANKIFYLLLVFLGITLLIVIAAGIIPIAFSLSDTILITLLATTSANVIGIFIFVVKYIFKANTCPNCGIRVTQNQTINH
jgi:hypothetical protein